MTEEVTTETSETATLETESGEVSNPHDKGYKRPLAHPKQFLHFLKTEYPD